MNLFAFFLFVVCIIGLLFLVFAISNRIKNSMGAEEREKEAKRRALIQRKINTVKSKLAEARKELENSKSKLRRLVLDFDKEFDPFTVRIEQIEFRLKHLLAFFQMGERRGFASQQQIINLVEGIKQERKSQSTWEYNIKSYTAEISNLEKTL